MTTIGPTTKALIKHIAQIATGCAEFSRETTGSTGLSFAIACEEEIDKLFRRGAIGPETARHLAKFFDVTFLGLGSLTALMACEPLGTA